MPAGQVTAAVALPDPAERARVRRVLEESGQFRVVLDVGDAVTAVEGVTRLRPELLVIALRLDELSGLEAIPAIRARSPRTSVVVAAEADLEAGVRLSRRLGARGWITPLQSDAEILATLEAATRHELRGVPWWTRVRRR